MWRVLRNRSFLGLKFRRQHQFGSYILDFYCDDLKLAVELDGEGHLTKGGSEADAVRDRYLKERGLTVIRIENHELITDAKWPLDRLERIVKALRGGDEKLGLER